LEFSCSGRIINFRCKSWGSHIGNFLLIYLEHNPFPCIHSLKTALQFFLILCRITDCFIMHVGEDVLLAMPSFCFGLDSKYCATVRPFSSIVILLCLRRLFMSTCSLSHLEFALIITYLSPFLPNSHFPPFPFFFFFFFFFSSFLFLFPQYYGQLVYEEVGWQVFCG
jgi:hypothetical protein